MGAPVEIAQKGNLGCAGNKERIPIISKTATKVRPPGIGCTYGKVEDERGYKKLPYAKHAARLVNHCIPAAR